MTEDEKYCTKCEQSKTLSCFAPDVRCRLGVRGICRDCEHAYKKSLRYRDIDESRRKERAKGKRLRAAFTAEQWAQHNKNARNSHAKSPSKVRARRLAIDAIRTGILIRKPCERCSKTPAQAHHEDYGKPLDVMWLCSLHHGERHRELKAEGREP